ncbi:hypothetical protein CYMTET_41405 [Cymbomonas tetramitiformis]|uniref:Uncharacterized protein n=1 Tax=Cymbomonas tetramitiformis TaxID=36881 RepID=A0AAE0F2N2_9CHLO|nr:hypothetical protein CYMTET_41405 [Cymbomonas tetramitiformis]
MLPEVTNSEQDPLRSSEPYTVDEEDMLSGENAQFDDGVVEANVSPGMREHDGPADYIQRHSEHVRKAVVSALHTWTGSRAHEIAMIRLLCDPTDRTHQTLRRVAERTDTDNHVPTAFLESELCMPQNTKQFTVSDAGEWCFNRQYLADTFPRIPRRLAVQAGFIADQELDDEAELQVEGTLETLCHVFAANTHSAICGFMQQHGHTLFEDMPGVAADTGSVRWRFVGAEYPVYNPNAVFFDRKRVSAPPLFYESRADAVMHATWVRRSDAASSSGHAAANHPEGRVIIVEYKMLMEQEKATGRVLEIRHVRQCLTNAFMYYLSVGILPSHCLVVLGTRRTDYVDRPMTRSPTGESIERVAYVVCVRVDLTVRSQMRLFQRVVMAPRQSVSSYDMYYMDENHFLLKPDTIKLSGRGNQYDKQFAFGVPPKQKASYDMPAMFCRDDVRCPEFAITRLCVAMHELHRRMWHRQGTRMADDSDRRVRHPTGYYPEQRSIDLALQALADSRRDTPMPNDWRKTPIAANVPAVPRNTSLFKGSSVAQLRTADHWEHFAMRYNLLPSSQRFCQLTHQDMYLKKPDSERGDLVAVCGYLLRTLEHYGAEVGERESDVEAQADARSVETPSTPSNPIEAPSHATTSREESRLRHQRYLHAPRVHFDTLRMTITRNRPTLGTRSYAGEPDINAQIRSRVNAQVKRKAATLATRFRAHTALEIFDAILTMLNPIDGSAQFNSLETEPYGASPDDARRRQARIVVIARAIHRLVNVRIHAAVCALVGSATGSGWFAGRSLDPEYSEAQVFPHISDRGRWSTFVLNLLEADMTGYGMNQRQAGRVSAHQVLDVAAADIQLHLQTCFQPAVRPPVERTRVYAPLPRPAANATPRAEKTSIERTFVAVTTDAASRLQAPASVARHVDPTPHPNRESPTSVTSTTWNELDAVNLLMDWYFRQIGPFGFPLDCLTPPMSDVNVPSQSASGTPTATRPLPDPRMERRAKMAVAFSKVLNGHTSDIKKPEKQASAEIELHGLLREHADDDPTAARGSSPLTFFRIYKYLLQPVALALDVWSQAKLLQNDATTALQEQRLLTIGVFLPASRSHPRSQQMTISLTSRKYVLTGVVLWHSTGYVSDILTWDSDQREVRSIIRRDRPAVDTANWKDVTAAYAFSDDPPDLRKLITPDTKGEASRVYLYSRAPLCRRCDFQEAPPPTHAWAYCSTPTRHARTGCDETTCSWLLCPLLYTAAGCDLHVCFHGTPIEYGLRTGTQRLQLAWKELVLKIRNDLVVYARANARYGTDSFSPRMRDDDTSRWLQAYLRTYDHSAKYHICEKYQKLLCNAATNMQEILAFFKLYRRERKASFPGV